MTGWNPSDVAWETYTCVLGFSVGSSSLENIYVIRSWESGQSILMEQILMPLMSRQIKQWYQSDYALRNCLLGCDSRRFGYSMHLQLSMCCQKCTTKSL